MTANAEPRCRLASTGRLGTILENHGNGWMTILFDGAPTCQDMWAPLTRGLIELVELERRASR